MGIGKPSSPGPARADLRRVVHRSTGDAFEWVGQKKTRDRDEVLLKDEILRNPKREHSGVAAKDLAADIAVPRQRSKREFEIHSQKC